ncbi:MAG: tyrosine-type recombinase/integrase [Terracidiphilus sp.]
MALYKRGEVYHFDFAVDGRRYRGSTKEKILSRARMIESQLMNEAKQRRLTVQRRTQTLADFSKRFLAWVDTTRLELETKKYYKSGWKMLSMTPIACVRLGHISTDDAEALRFKHSSANANRALRTLRRMLGKATEWGLIGATPKIKLAKEQGRSEIIDNESETKLLAAAKQPLQDVLTIMLDTGMRPGEVFRMCWEDISWERRTIFIPKGKTPRSRRYVVMSERMIEALDTRRNGQLEGWVFPSDSKDGHVTTVAKAFEEARDTAGLSKEIKLYSARHTFATKVMGETGDLALVMRALGHTNAQTAMIYQHPSLERVRAIVNERPAPAPKKSGLVLAWHNPRHNDAA